MKLQPIKYRSVYPGQKFMVNDEGPYLMTEHISSYTTKWKKSKDCGDTIDIDPIIVRHAFHIESGRELDPYTLGCTWTSINNLNVDLITNM